MPRALSILPVLVAQTVCGQLRTAKRTNSLLVVTKLSDELPGHTVRKNVELM